MQTFNNICPTVDYVINRSLTGKVGQIINRDKGLQIIVSLFCLALARSHIVFNS